MIVTWPSWHPEQELKADHLIALEDYLLTRVLMVDEGAWGVESLDDWRQSVTVEAAGAGLTIRVTQVRGVTPGGHHIWLWSAAESLQATLDEIGRGGQFDLRMLVNSREKDAPKLTLRAAAVPAGNAAAVVPCEMPDQLYLGRYRADNFGGEIRLELVHPPVPRRFAGVGPGLGEWWREWTRPLAGRIQEVFRELGAQPQRTPGQLAAAVEIARLVFEWPSLTIPVLARRLKLIDWLRTQADSGAAPDPCAAAVPLSWSEVTGDRLPEILAALLPAQARADLPVGSPFDILVRFLRDGISYYAPIDAFLAWVNFVENPHTTEENAALRRQAEAFLQSDYSGANRWVRTAALITAWVFHGAASSSINSSSICDALQGLFRSEAREARAGPLAFSFLARTALRDAEVRRAASPDLQAYARLFEPGTKTGDLDRVCGFLTRYLTAPDALDPLPWLWCNDLSSARGELSAPGELRFAILGGPGSGKSALARAITDEFGRLGSEAVRLSIVETRSGVQSSPAPNAPDVIVAAIDPSAVARAGAGDLATTCNAVRRAIQARPGAALVLAYTKADEYGVADPRAVRLIGTPAHADSLQRFRGQADENLWEEFVSSAVADRSLRRHEGGAVFSHQAKGSVSEAEWSATRAWAIRQTRTLWDLGLQLPTALLNGYFMAAESRDPYLKVGGRSGIGQMLADLLLLFKVGRATAGPAVESAAAPSRPRGSLGRRELL